MRDPKLTIFVANTIADAYARLLDGAKLRIYGGDIPATASTALTIQVLAAEHIFPNPSAPAAQNGMISLYAISPATGLATVEATFFRVLRYNGDVLIQDTVGDADLGAPVVPFGLVLPTRFIIQNAVIPVNFFNLAQLLDA